MASKLKSKPMTPQELARRHQSYEHEAHKIIKSNKDHVAAILATDMVFRRMTPLEIKEVKDWVKSD